MVGGEIIEVIPLEDRVWVNCRDKIHPRDECAVYVARNDDSEKIAKGDSLWWQGRSAYWTPADGSRHDVEVEKVSGSGVGRPAGY